MAHCSMVSIPIYQNGKNWSLQINPSQINPATLKKSIGRIRTRTLAFKFELLVRRFTSVQIYKACLNHPLSKLLGKL